jgi:hypothetical protein
LAPFKLQKPTSKANFKGKMRMTQEAQTQRTAIVKSLGTLLRTAHSALIQSLKKRRETQMGRELTPFEWFQQLSGQPEYRWMQPLMALMSDIDALLDNRHEVTEKDLAVIRSAITVLFGVDANDFRNHYFDALAADPELIPSHATLKRVVDQLQKLEIPGEAAEDSLKEAAEIRRSWHISERRLAHMRSNKSSDDSNK